VTVATGGEAGVPAASGQPPGPDLLPPGFLFGVATAGFQIEGGFNGPGQPANNWLAWEQVGRVEPSGDAVDFWADPDVALDRAAALGCDSFRLGIEWARILPDGRGVDRAALDRYVAIVDGCVARGMTPLVTLHHFTHPEWLGEDLWLRPDAPARFAAYARVVVAALAPSVRHWVTVNEINVLTLMTHVLGAFPPGRTLGFAEASIAVDNLLCAHVFAYDTIHAERPDAVVTTNNACVTLYEYDRMLVDLLLARSHGVDRGDLDEWIAERRRGHYALLATPGPGEALLRRASTRVSPYGTGHATRHATRHGTRHGASRSSGTPRRVLDALDASPHDRTLDVLGIDYYDPLASRHFRLPGHRTAGGRNRLPSRELWDDPPDPGGLARWLGVQHALAPGLPLWVVENGMCNRVRDGRSFGRLDGWDRPRYVRENLAAVVSAIDAGVPVEGYWHWSLVDNYEWGSYQPRFGLYGVDRDRGDGGVHWRETDAMGRDAAGEYRRVIAGLRAGDRSVLDPA
jgi:beta-glucosidase/6-phospho-beta-glucosidase/beta-galactosidase